jgi:cell division transport system permease protein
MTGRLFAALGFAMRRGALGVRRRTGATVWAALAVAAALFALGATRLIDRNVGSLTRAWPGGVDMVVYLDDAVADDRARALADALAALPAVERVDYVPPSAALEHLRGALDEQAALLDGAEPGLVPASLEVALVAGVKDVVATHPIIARLRATPGVEDVEFVGDWVERAGALSAGLRRGGAVAVGLAGLLAVILIASAVRLAVAGRRREARVLDLLGATAAFQRGPAVVHGLVTGLVGAGLACLALALGYREVVAPIGAALGVALGGGELGFLAAGDLARLALAGGGLGALGGYLAGAGGRREMACA